MEPAPRVPPLTLAPSPTAPAPPSPRSTNATLLALLSFYYYYLISLFRWTSPPTSQAPPTPRSIIASPSPQPSPSPPSPTSPPSPSPPHSPPHTPTHMPDLKREIGCNPSTHKRNSKVIQGDRILDALHIMDGTTPRGGLSTPKRRCM